MTGRAMCGRFVTESAHRVRPSRGIVAPEGGGQKVPTLRGRKVPGLAGAVTAERGPIR
jgi:hypothetical protein